MRPINVPKCSNYSGDIANVTRHLEEKSASGTKPAYGFRFWQRFWKLRELQKKIDSNDPENFSFPEQT